MPGFDPDQPRDEIGQWTDTGAADAIRKAASFNTQLMKGLKMVGVEDYDDDDLFEQVKKDLEFDEEVIRNQKYEFATAYDADGNKIFDKITQGNERAVEFEEEHMARMKGGILTHNHPGGRSFSLPDMRIAYQTGLKSIRVAGSKEYDYEFFPNHKFFNFEDIDDVKRFVQIYNLINDNVRDDFTEKIWNDEITEDYANANHHHEVNQRFSKEIGAKYIRKRNNNQKQINFIIDKND